MLYLNLHLLKEVLYVSSGTYLLGELIKFVISKCCRLNFIILQQNAKAHLFSNRLLICSIPKSVILPHKKQSNTVLALYPLYVYFTQFILYFFQTVLNSSLSQICQMFIYSDLTATSILHTQNWNSVFIFSNEA